MNKSARNDKATLSLLIVGIAFVIFLVFYRNQDNIMGVGNFYPFIIASTLGLALLVFLFYLISNRKTKSVSSHTKKRRKK